MNTKEKIFDVSIDLFSEHGYDGVSIRRIARAVGIKESSIYNHFKSKESILDEILNYYINEMTREEISTDTAGRNLDIGFDYFYKEGLDLYMSKLSDERMMKITRIIIIESYHNEKIRSFIKDFMIEEPIKGWIELFDLMKEKNLIIRECDSNQLARSFFYYGMFLLIEHFTINYPEDDMKFLNQMALKSQNHMKLIYNSVKVRE